MCGNECLFLGVNWKENDCWIVWEEEGADEEVLIGSE